MNATQAAILRALELCRVLDVEHNAASVHLNFRAVRHELKTLEGLHFPPSGAPRQAPEPRSASVGRATRPGSLRHKILGALESCALPDFQLTNILLQAGDLMTSRDELKTVRRRRHELVAAGWVEAVLLGDGVRKVRQERTGRDCTVYQLTDRGHAALRRLRSGQEVLFTV